MSLPKCTYPLFKFTVPGTKKEISMRPMLVKEEKILLMAKQGRDYNEIMHSVGQVLNNCIVDKSFDIFSQPIFVLEYLFLKLRSISVDNIAKVRYVDGEDQKERDFDIDLTTVEVTFPDPAPESVIKMNDKTGISLKYPPASIFNDKNFKGAKDDAFEVMVLKGIDKIFEGDKIYKPEQSTPEELLEFINNLDLKTYEKVKEFFVQMPTLKHVITYTNTKGSERKITLTSLEDFFTLA